MTGANRLTGGLKPPIIELPVPLPGVVVPVILTVKELLVIGATTG